MAVKLRFSRCGCRNKPFYRVIAADSKCLRDGKHLEVLGFYDPLSGKDEQSRMRLKVDRVKYWLSVGAQPSDPVQSLLFRSGLLPPPLMTEMGRKGGPREMHPIDPMTGRFITPETSKKVNLEFEVNLDEDKCANSAETSYLSVGF